MSSLSLQKIQQLRSGQMVWRVWGQQDSETGAVTASATCYTVLGKKRHVAKVYQTTYMECKRPVEWDGPIGNRIVRAKYLDDLQGIRCFKSKRAADRFVREINKGLHPDVTQMLLEHFEDMKTFKDNPGVTEE